jgi:pilus assembly protein CpaB
MLGCVAAGIAWRQAARMSAANAAAGRALRVVMTTQRVEEFAPIATEALTVQEVDRRSIPEGAVRSVEEVKNCVAARPLHAGSVLRSEDLLSVETLGLAAEIPPGRRAMTVEVDRVANVGGVLKPGRFVDVIATFDEGRVAKTVIQRVQVMAVYRRQAREVQGEETGGREPDNMLVTLAVTPVEANRLALADEAGELRLALRPVRDTDWEGVLPTGATTLRDLLGDAAEGLERRSTLHASAPKQRAEAEAEAESGDKPTAEARPGGRAAAISSATPRTRRPVRLGPPPDFGAIPAPLLSAPAMAPPPAPVVRSREVPSPASAPWHVTVIRGTQVETVPVER